MRASVTASFGGFAGAALIVAAACSIPDRSLFPPGDDAGQDADTDTTSAASSDAGNDATDATALHTEDGGPPDATNIDAGVDAAPPSGSLDTSFGGTGIVTIPSAGNLAGNGLTVQRDESVLYCGAIEDDQSGTTLLVLGRVTPSGAPDGTFAGGRLTSLTMPYNQEECGAVAVTPTEDIAVTGFLHYSDIANLMFVARFTPIGVPDPTFGGTGIVPIFDNYIDSKAGSIVVQSDGRIIAGGFQGNSPAIVRLNGDGGADDTFDPTPPPDASIGVLTPDAPVANVTQLALLPDGDVVAALQSSSSFFATRLTSGGALEPNYGESGFALADAGFGDGCDDVVVQAGGAIVCLDSNPANISLARFTPSGSLDTSFGQGGIASVPSMGLTAVRVFLLGDGSFAVGLWSDSNQIGVARLNAQGALDLSFGNEGFSLIPIATSSSLAMAIDPLGRIVIAVGGVDGNESVVLARFWP